MSSTSQFSTLHAQLYRSSHDLLQVGEDGSPIFAMDFSRLNTEVYRLIDALYPLTAPSDEDEAAACLALLMGFSATIYTSERQEEKIQTVLDRSFKILSKLDRSLLKCRLLLYCYMKVQDEALKEEAKEIIIGWGGRELTKEEEEVMGVWNGVSNK